MATYPGNVRDPKFAPMAFAVVAEKLVRASKGRVHRLKDRAQATTDAAEDPERRALDQEPSLDLSWEAARPAEGGALGYTADILRTCRSHAIPVDMACFDYLLELCLEGV